MIYDSAIKSSFFSHINGNAVVPLFDMLWIRLGFEREAPHSNKLHFVLHLFVQMLSRC